MTRLSWRYGEIDVHYSPELDGDGTSMASQFIDYLRANHPGELPFGCAFEWCSGPGFIGFALLAEGLCERLVLADINPAAVDAARSTVIANGLEDQVEVFLSDNLAAIPTQARFDLVVSNPPNYYCLNPRHPWYDALKDDLRPNDPGWVLHRAFYRDIPKFLNPGALLVIEEVDPHAVACFLPNNRPDLPLWGPEPFDLRPRPPLDDFLDMIEFADLSYLETVVMPHPQLPVHLVVSRNDTTTRTIRLREDVSVYEGIGAGRDNGFHAIAVRSGRLQDDLSLNQDQLWAIDLLELLVKGRPTGFELSRLSSELDIAEGELRPLLVVLRRNGWIHAPGLES